MLKWHRDDVFLTSWSKSSFRTLCFSQSRSAVVSWKREKIHWSNIFQWKQYIFCDSSLLWCCRCRYCRWFNRYRLFMLRTITQQNRLRRFQNQFRKTLHTSLPAFFVARDQCQLSVLLHQTFGYIFSEKTQESKIQKFFALVLIAEWKIVFILEKPNPF